MERKVKNQLYTGIIAATLLSPSFGFTWDNPEWVNPVTIDILTMTETGLGTVQPEHLDASQIRQIQRKLRKENFYKGEISGIWDFPTAAGVKEFEENYHLRAGGLITTSTLAQLGVPVEIHPILQRLIAPAAGETYH